MIKVLKSILLPILFITLAGQAVAQQDAFFDRIANGDKPFSEMVACILKDSKGFLLLGTGTGIYRYNGKKMEVFLRELAPFDVRKITEDKSGHLWIGTSNGLYVYHPDTRKTTHINSDDQNKPLGQVYDILNEDSVTWLAASRGAYKVHPESFKTTRVDLGNFFKEGVVAVASFEGKTIFGSYDGVLSYNRTTQQITTLIDTRHTKETGRASSDNTQLWITSLDGKLLSFCNGTLTTYELSAQFPGILLSTVIDDNKGNLWIGTYGSGLLKLNKSSRQVTQFKFKEPDTHSINSNIIYSLLQSPNGDIWIGTESGLSRFHPGKQGFHRVTMQELLPHGSQGSDYVRNLYEDTKGNIWLGTFGNGLIQLNPQGKFISHKTFKSSNYIICLTGGTDGRIYLSLPNSIVKLNDQCEVEKEYKSSPVSTANVIGLVNENYIYFDKRINDSISFIDIRQDMLVTRKLTGGINETLDTSINAFKPDKDGLLWVLTSKGILRIDPADFTYKWVKLFDEDYVSMDMDEEGNLWMVSSTSLATYKAADGTFKKFQFKESVGTIVSKLIYHNENLWVATTNSIIRFTIASEKFTFYSESEGIKPSTFSWEAAIKTKSNKIMFGTERGILEFYPDSVHINTSAPPVSITDLKILNQSILDFREEEKELFGLTTRIENASHILLPYNKNFISFEFVALDFTSPLRNSYSYKLIGNDYEWTNSGNQNIATYTNLDPGTYTFHVKGSNNDGVWNEQGASIKITILPPPWKTWWAYSLYGLGLLLLLVAGRDQIIRRERLRAKAKLKEAEAEKYHELDMLKSRFFANISHEFRTPLTLLLGPIEKRLAAAKEAGDKTELNMMHRNASRLLTLVNQLLDLSRVEAGTLKLQCSYSSLNSFVHSIASQFSSMADSKQIDFVVHVQQEITLYFDADKLEKIITNLLSNAFKFTPTRGSITLTLNQHGPTENYKDGFAEIIVTDTGTGIDAQHLPKIFDRFYQADASSTRAYEGTGIGLALTKELAELHGGSVTVTSARGEGSCFTVQLPLGHTHLKAQEIY